jgi:hypothetical protein
MDKILTTIIESLAEIQISIAADNVQCWESPYCPYCMLDGLKSRLEKELEDAN